MPFYRLLGNKDASDIHGKINFLTRLNMEFYDYAERHDDFYASSHIAGYLVIFLFDVQI